MVWNKDLVSIITPAYNSENFIEETINSVKNQTYTNWEMIIVDDNSTDGTREIVKHYCREDKRIKLIVMTENAGAAVARNKALKEAEGKYVAFLDSDDKWKPDKLKLQIEFMKKNNYGFTFTKYEYINDEKNELKKEFPVPLSLNYFQALKTTVIGCLTVVIDREIIGDFEMPLVRRGQDNLTWLEILKRGHIAYGYNVNLAEYRRVSGSLSNNKFKAIKRQWNNYRYEVKLPLVKCVYYYTHYVFNSIKKYYLS